MKWMYASWWKVLCAALLGYAIVYGFLSQVPRLEILNETIRNLFFHVPMWFTMYSLFVYSLFHSVMYLRKPTEIGDHKARISAETGFFFGMLGIVTGSIWARFTWGTWWEPRDPKLNGAAIALLIYLAYFVLRSAVEDENKRARLAAVYNIFAFPMQLAVTYIIPKFMISLHPGSADTVNFKQYDMNSDLRWVFYPAVLGWILLGFWIFSLSYRTLLLKIKSENETY